MSVRVMALVYAVPLGSVVKKAIALKLADHADDAGCNIYPSVETIAKATEADRRTVQRTLKAFVSDGLLVLVSRGGGRKATARYRINLQWLLARVENSGAVPPFIFETAAGSREKGGRVPPEPSLNHQKKRSAPKLFVQRRSKTVTVRDTSEAFADYQRRMIEEGLFRP